MNPQELRIGNYVYKSFFNEQVPHVIESGKDIDNAHTFKPAKLCNVLLDRTLEWYEPLKHWRVVKDDVWYSIRPVKPYIVDRVDLNKDEGRLDFIKIVTYMHELQNIIFELTGVELIVGRDAR